MRMRSLIPAVLAGAALLALPGTAGAVTCTHPSSAYSSGTGVESFDGPTTGDPLGPAQWGLNQVKAPAAWKRGAKGTGVTVAVLDTGADFSHPDLQGRLLPGTDYVRE